MSVFELYALLSEENKARFDLFVAQLKETQDSSLPAPDSQA